jgi:hypothetical protein
MRGLKLALIVTKTRARHHTGCTVADANALPPAAAGFSASIGQNPPEKGYLRGH